MFLGPYIKIKDIELPIFKEYYEIPTKDNKKLIFPNVLKAYTDTHKQ